MGGDLLELCEGRTEREGNLTWSEFLLCLTGGSGLFSPGSVSTPSHELLLLFSWLKLDIVSSEKLALLAFAIKMCALGLRFFFVVGSD